MIGAGPQNGDVIEAGVRRRVFGRVLVLSMTHPLGKGRSAAICGSLVATLSEAEADPSIDALVLTGDARTFFADPDVAERAGLPGQGPPLSDLCARLEGLAKPVVAALRGKVFGGGLELAMAAHYRIAEAGARLGFPEIGLGLFPGAGGTQRLPRLIGAEQALRLILSGKPVSAAEAVAMGLLDHVHETGAMEAALALAQSGPLPRRTLDRRSGMRDIAGYQEAVRRARLALGERPLLAAARAVDCVEAALLLPADQALDYERAAHDDVVSSAQSKAIRHLSVAERRAVAWPLAGSGGVVPRLASVGFWGGTRESADLAARALSAGLAVTLAEPNRDALVAALRHIADRAEARVTSGQLTPEARDADWARLTSVLTVDGLRGADLVVAAPGAPALPTAMALGPLIRLGAQGEGGVAICPDRNLLEIVSDTRCLPDHVAMAVALAGRVGARGVHVGPGGPVAGRLRGVLAAALAHLRAEGVGAGVLDHVRAVLAGDATPQSAPAVTEALRGCLLALANEGARMVVAGTVRRPGDIDVVAVLAGLVPRRMGGPMHQADLRGLLLVRADLVRLQAGSPDLFAPSALFDDLISKGKRLEDLNL